MSSNTNPGPSIAEAKPVDYSKLIPFVSAGLILLGVSRLIAYYNFFGVNVLSFLEFSEILTSFLDLIVTNTLTLALLWVTITWLPKKDEKIIEIKKKHYPAFIFFFVTMILLIPLYFYDRKTFWSIIILGGITLIPFSFFYSMYRKSNSQLIRDLCLLSITLTTFEGIIIFSSISDYRRVKNEKKYYGTKIVFNNDTFLNDSSHILISDSSNFYIGKTNNFIFIHHMKEKITSVYPMTSVVQMDIKSKSSNNWVINLIE